VNERPFPSPLPPSLRVEDSGGRRGYDAEATRNVFADVLTVYDTLRAECERLRELTLDLRMEVEKGRENERRVSQLQGQLEVARGERDERGRRIDELEAALEQSREQARQLKDALGEAWRAAAWGKAEDAPVAGTAAAPAEERAVPTEPEPGLGPQTDEAATELERATRWYSRWLARSHSVD